MLSFVFQLWKFHIFSMNLFTLSKIPTITVPGHVSEFMSVLLFTQQPYLSWLPKLLALRLKKPVLELHSLLIGLFRTFKAYKLNLSVDSISMRDLVSPSQLNLWEWTLSAYSPGLLLARILSYTEFAKLSYHQFMTFRRYAWHFI